MMVDVEKGFKFENSYESCDNSMVSQQNIAVYFKYINAPTEYRWNIRYHLFKSIILQFNDKYIPTQYLNDMDTIDRNDDL